MTSQILPLDDVKVLEIAHYIAGPAACMTLADLGADVIKVEPPGGEPARQSSPMLNDESLYFATFNTGKRSVCLDLRSPDGKERLIRLIRWCDVLVTNYLPGVPERLGFGFDTVSALNPLAVMVHITGFGSWSALGSHAAFDSVIQAMSGLADMVGEPNGMPNLSSLRLADHITAQQAASAALAALRLRDKTHEGSFVEISMLRALTPLLGELISQTSELGIRPTRSGNRRTGVFVNMFSTLDGALVVSPLTPEQWAAFCKVIGRPEWGASEVVHTQRHVLDLAVRDDLEQSTKTWAGSRSSIDAAAELQAAGVPGGPVWSVSDLIEANERFDLRLFGISHLTNGAQVMVPASPFEWGAATPSPTDERVHGIDEDSESVFGVASSD